MKVSGFTFIRNAEKYDYPAIEAINSILPICDEVVVAIGNSEDNTLELIQSIASEKIRIIQTVWDDHLRKGGRVLAIETNKAFAEVARDADWAFYIQSDEIVHEKFLGIIQQKMQEYKDDPRVEGLLFKYLHFYGSYDYIGNSRRWYRREIRIIRNNQQIRSYRDAQGFRKQEKKLRVKLLDAYIYHYGWVKHPYHQQLKQQNFNRYWHNDEWVDTHISQEELFDYSQIDSLEKFTATHPAVMQERIQKVNWKFAFDPTQKKHSLKERCLSWTEKYTGWRIGEYKNYTLI